MRYISWALRILLFLLLFGFVLKNTEPVVVRFYLGSQWEASLAVVVLVFFSVGAAAGVIACLAHVYRQRREILQLRKEARAKPASPVDAP
ncbi:MAG: LapA family protein [Betaproteobacteria bacterium]